MITLRSYQKDAIQAITEEFLSLKRQYIEMPTGAGKTITFLSFAKRFSNYTLIVVPSKELLKQVYESALLFWEPREISRKGNGYDEELSNVHICIINSLNARYLDEISTGEFELIIIDEAHHIQAKSYKRLVETFSKCQAFSPFFLGVTATPDRSDGKMMEEILFKKTFCIEIEHLIEEKHLSDIEGYAVKTNMDLSDIDDHNGDFSILQLYEKLSNETRNNLILDICKNQMNDRKSLIFCINVKHSIEIAQLLEKNGLSARAIYGNMKESEKQSILKAFRVGEISYLCNCQLLTEGFDEPSIDGIVLARPTRSRALFMQMIGRGLRTCKGKENCKIVDIVDNHRHLSGFTSILDEEKRGEISAFKSIRDIRQHIDKQILDSIETKIQRIDMFGSNDLDHEASVDSMEEYLKQNNLMHYGNLSFDEASFLIWHNELKKEYMYASAGAN